MPYNSKVLSNQKADDQQVQNLASLPHPVTSFGGGNIPNLAWDKMRAEAISHCYPFSSVKLGFLTLTLRLVIPIHRAHGNSVNQNLQLSESWVPWPAWSMESCPRMAKETDLSLQ